jgi:hypothetical protein
MTDHIAATNKALLRRFYKEVYVDWNMGIGGSAIDETEWSRT